MRKKIARFIAGLAIALSVLVVTDLAWDGATTVSAAVLDGVGDSPLVP